MPGAISRSTASAVRWNSFQPLRIRHGSDQLFRVTTGLNHGPVVGSGGTSRVVVIELGDSGSEASAEREINPAPMAAATPAPFRKFLRSVIVQFL